MIQEEEVLVKCLLFLNGFNIPANGGLLYHLGHNLLDRDDPNRTL